MPGGQLEAVPYYIFNMDSSGWVIVSGDDVAYPVIGYSTNSRIDPQNQPPAFIEWMRQAEEQIKSAIQQNLQQRSSDPTTIKIQNAWTNLSDSEGVKTESSASEAGTLESGTITSVSPLLGTTWSQGAYYNTECPDDEAGPDDHAVVGCCATAMGQIMKFHEWPITGTGSHTYTHSTYGALSANFGATTYDWDSMPTGFLSGHNNAVATLLYHAGVSVNMNYGYESSGCYPNAICTGA